MTNMEATEDCFGPKHFQVGFFPLSYLCISIVQICVSFFFFLFESDGVSYFIYLSNFLIFF